jgi:putative phosphoesterase
MLRIGLISDTHGLLRPEAERFLRGCDHIVHAGDIGNERVLSELAEIAPVTAVRGNNDTGEWAAPLPQTQSLALGGVAIFVLHDVQDLRIHPHPADAQVVICGHSHKAQVLRQPSGMLIINPGSAGPRRFKLPVTAAELLISDESIFQSRIIDLL